MLSLTTKTYIPLLVFALLLLEPDTSSSLSKSTVDDGDDNLSSKEI